MACKCGCGGLPEHDFMEKLQQLRDEVGFSLPISSGFRCPEHNNFVSKTGLTGPHTTGRAADIRVSRTRAYIMLNQALRLGFTGIGINQRGASRFLHLDTLENSAKFLRPTIWSY